MSNGFDEELKMWVVRFEPVTNPMEKALLEADLKVKQEKAQCRTTV